MATRANFDRNQARQLVEKIADDHGHISEEWWGKLDPETRKFFQGQWHKRNNHLTGPTVVYAITRYYHSCITHSHY